MDELLREEFGSGYTGDGSKPEIFVDNQKQIKLSKVDSPNSYEMVAQVHSDVLGWTLFEDQKTTCWITKQPSKIAAPSLRNCYDASQDSCCNFVEDSVIGDQLSSFVPGPCLGDEDHYELSLFQCMACEGGNGGINNFTVKADPTSNFVKQMAFYKSIQ